MNQFEKMARDIRKFWDKTVIVATSQYSLSQTEKELIERIGTVIDTNSRAALSMVGA